MHRLLFTADDFGLTDGVCAGIVEARRNGVVARTSAMVCAPGAIERLRVWAPKFPGRIGIHLQLTDGRPCLDPPRVSSLVTADGEFPREPLVTWPFEKAEVALEWRAQIAALRGLGVEISHLDTHQHVHCQHNELFETYIGLAREYNLPARTIPGWNKSLRAAGVRSADHCETSFYCDDPTLSMLSRAIIHGKALTPIGGLIEMMCHPGYVTEELAAVDSYVRQREQELEVLTNRKLVPRLAKLAVQVVEQE